MNQQLELWNHIRSRGQEVAPEVWIYPFHQNYAGLENLFHVLCEEHGDRVKGVLCGTELEVRETAMRHWTEIHA